MSKAWRKKDETRWESKRLIMNLKCKQTFQINCLFFARIIRMLNTWSNKDLVKEKKAELLGEWSHCYIFSSQLLFSTTYERGLMSISFGHRTPVLESRVEYIDSKPRIPQNKSVWRFEIDRSLQNLSRKFKISITPGSLLLNWQNHANL